MIKTTPPGILFYHCRSTGSLSSCTVSYLSAFDMGGSLWHTAIPYTLQGDMWDLCWWGQCGYQSYWIHIRWTPRRHELHFYCQRVWIWKRQRFLYWPSAYKYLLSRYDGECANLRVANASQQNLHPQSPQEFHI